MSEQTETKPETKAPEVKKFEVLDPLKQGHFAKQAATTKPKPQPEKTDTGS